MPDTETIPKPKLSVDDFAAKIKTKYPEYKDVDNSLLAKKIIDKNPEYKDIVDFSLKKKDNTTSALPNGVKTLQPGLNSFQTSQNSQSIVPNQSQLDIPNNGFRNVMPVIAHTAQTNNFNIDQSKTDPVYFSQKKQDEDTELQNQQVEAKNQKAKDAFEAPYRKDGFWGGVKLGAKYATSKALQGGVETMRGLAKAATMVDNLIGEGNVAGEKKVSDFFDALDKKSAIGVPETYEPDKVLGAVGGVLKVALPTIAASSTGGASYIMQGMGGADKQINDLKKQGVTFPNHSDDLYITGAGLINYLLMDKLNAHTIFSKVPSELREKAVSNLAMEAISDMSKSGAPLTTESLTKAMQDKATSFSDKLATHGLQALKSYGLTAADLTAFNTADFANKKLSNAVGGDENFHETLGDLTKNIGDVLTTQAPLFSLGAIGRNSGVLFDKSPIKNDIVESIKKDDSPENIQNIKQQLSILKEKGLSDQDIHNSIQHVDNIAQAVKSIPKHLDDDKYNKAVDLVIGKNQLERELSDKTKSKEAFDPAVKDILSPQEQLLSDKIEQANDKLRDIVGGTKTTYSKGIENEEGKFFKTTNGVREKISPQRYDLERTERDSKVIPVERAVQPGDTGMPTLSVNVDAQTGNHEAKLPEVDTHGNVSEVHDEENNNLPLKPNENESTYQKIGHKEESGYEESHTKDGSKEAHVGREESDVIKSGVDETAPDNLRQKAIDVITHGIAHQTSDSPRGTDGAFYFGMDLREKNKAVNDVANGNYDTAPAKKMIDKIVSWEKDGQYPVIDGTGGKTSRNRSAPAEEIQQHLDAAKSFELDKERNRAEANKTLLSEGFTDKDFEDYERTRKEIESGRGNGRNVELPAKDVQRAKDDQAASDPQKTGGEAIQGKPEKIKTPSLTEVEAARKMQLRKKFMGTLNDITRIPTLLADKEFREYAGLVFKEAAGDFKAFSSELIESVGEKIKEHLPALFKELAKASDDTSQGDETEHSLSNGSETEQTVYGTKNSITKALREGLGLPTIEVPKDRSDDESLNAWKSGTRTPVDIIDALLDDNKNIYDKSITPNDEPIVREYTKQLRKRSDDLNKILVDVEDKIKAADKNVSEGDVASIKQQIQNNYDLIDRAINASILGGNIWHKYGAERQIAIDEQGLVVNSIQRIKSIYGKDIPAAVKQELDDLQAKYDNLVAKNAKIEEQLKNQAVNRKLEGDNKNRRLFGGSIRKKTSEEYHKERVDIIEQMRKDLKKSLGQLNSTLPGVPQLNAIAPHVLRLLASFADEGISKIDDALVKIHDVVKDVLPEITKDDIRDIIAGQYSNKKKLSELRKQINDLRTQARNKAKIDQLENGIAIQVKKRGESSEEVTSLRKKVADLKKLGINDFADLSIDDLKNQINTIQNKINKGDFFKVPVVKRAWENNPEWLKNNKQKADLTFKLKKLESEALNSKKSAFMRALDFNNRWGRRVLFFFSNSVYTHLASSAVLGSTLHRIPEFGIGKVLNKMLPDLSENAPIEGHLNLKTEALWYGRIMNPGKTVKNTWSIIKNGETDLSRELSTRPHENHIPIVDLLAADGHIIIKDPFKEATYYASLEAHLNHFQNHGVDPSHPMMLEAAKQAAWQRAEYEIFQNSPKKANIVKAYFNGLEKQGIKNQTSESQLTRLKGNSQYAASALYNFLIPINTVPNNMVGRAMLAWRLPDKILKAFKVNDELRHGIDNLTAAQKDLLLLHIKKGAVGSLYWALGFMLAGKAAGGLYNSFYSDKDRDKPENGGGFDPYSNFLSVAGVNINKDWQHNYQAQAMQQGATWSMVRNHYINDNGTGQIEAMIKASAATGGVIADDVPTIKFAMNAAKAITNKAGEEKFFKDLKQRVGIKKAKDLVKLMGYNIDDDD